MSDLERLAELVRTRNAVEREIAAIVGRPALVGHVGEFIASRVFGIALEASAAQRAIDGHFREGGLAGLSVNIKWYTRREGMLDLRPDALPDFFLVLAGPKTEPASSRGTVRPWVIETVFLFDAAELVADLQSRGVKVGVASSVRQDLWQAAEIYPTQRKERLVLTAEHRRRLALFR